MCGSIGTLGNSEGFPNELTVALAPPGRQSITSEYQKVFTLGDNNETLEQWHALFPGKHHSFTGWHIHRFYQMRIISGWWLCEASHAISRHGQSCSLPPTPLLGKVIPSSVCVNLTTATLREYFEFLIMRAGLTL